MNAKDCIIIVAVSLIIAVIAWLSVSCLFNSILNDDDTNVIERYEVQLLNKYPSTYGEPNKIETNIGTFNCWLDALFNKMIIGSNYSITVERGNVINYDIIERVQVDHDNP